MSTVIAEPKIDQLGTTTIETDVPPAELKRGNGAILSMNPEKGESISFIAPSSDEGKALKTLFHALAQRQTPDAERVRQWVEQQVGYDLDWSMLDKRYEAVFAV